MSAHDILKIDAPVQKFHGDNFLSGSEPNLGLR
jgi:hypothetical protein